MSQAKYFLVIMAILVAMTSAFAGYCGEGYTCGDYSTHAGRYACSYFGSPSNTWVTSSSAAGNNKRFKAFHKDASAFYDGTSMVLYVDTTYYGCKSKTLYWNHGDKTWVACSNGVETEICITANQLVNDVYWSAQCGTDYSGCLNANWWGMAGPGSSTSCYSGSGLCEKACGADALCDEVAPSSTAGEIYCSSSCQALYPEESQDACEAASGSWDASSWSGDINEYCCGDEDHEYVKTRVCSGVCSSNSEDTACCYASSSCVYDGVCYWDGASVDVDGDSENEFCNGGTWIGCADDQEPEGACAFPICFEFCSDPILASCGTGFLTIGSLDCTCDAECKSTKTGTCRCLKTFVVDGDGDGYYEGNDICTDSLNSYGAGTKCDMTCNVFNTFTKLVTTRTCTAAAACSSDSSDKACCSPGSCVLSGSCVASGSCSSYSGSKVRCSSGTWYEPDEGSAYCSGTGCDATGGDKGIAWAVGGEVSPTGCCGDDAGEYYLARDCISGCTSDPSDDACCDKISDCVWNGECKDDGTKICNSNVVIECYGGKWKQVIDCNGLPSEESDNGKDYFLLGIVKDYTTCSSGGCSYNIYTDICSGNNLKEYYASGTSYGSVVKDCTEYSGCYGSCESGTCTYDTYACSNGACAVSSSKDPDDGPEYCSGCSKDWFSSVSYCCGDDGSEDNFLGTGAEDDLICVQGVQHTCSGSTYTTYLVGGSYYSCVDSQWVLASTVADGGQAPCEALGFVWTGNECCGNMADTDGDDEGVLGIEGTDNYQDGRWGCWNGISHHCTSQSCFGLNLSGGVYNDTWCVSSGWTDVVLAGDLCEDACDSVSGEWDSYWLLDSATTQCCGDDYSEVVSDVRNSATCATTGNKACCTGGQCGWFHNGFYSCISEGTECNGYLCEAGAWLFCEATPSAYCLNADTDNDGIYDKYCYNVTGAWNTPIAAMDFCRNACEQTGGMWTGVSLINDTKNCCNPMQEEETWCAGSYPTVVKCEDGEATDCNEFCDSSGVVDDDGLYSCTFQLDADCVSDSCNGDECNCKKFRGVNCTNNVACWDGACVPFTVVAGEEAVFSSVSNPDGFTGICCDAGGCAYDGNGDGVIDSCAMNDTASVDADGDGDVDYCLDGVWSECKTYSCTSAGTCGCAGTLTLKGACGFYGKTPGYYSTGNGLCMSVNTTFACGTPCDVDNSLITREYVNPDGVCIKGGGGCPDIFSQITWGGNTSDFTIKQKSECMCSSNITINVTILNGEDIVSSLETTVSEGESTIHFGAVGFRPGENRVIVNATCGNSLHSGTPRYCEVELTPVDYSISTTLISETFYCNHPAWVNITVNNQGNINLGNLTISGEVEGGVTLEVYETGVYLASGTQKQKNHMFSDVSCSLYQSTLDTGSNATPLNVNLSLIVDGELYGYLTKTQNNFQCMNTADCADCCGSPADNCWANGTAEAFTCSFGVCCESGDHFQNGACCDFGRTCCKDDAYCDQYSWCSNSSGYSEYGATFVCLSLLNNGVECNKDRMCSSGECNSFCCDTTEVADDVNGECYSQFEGTSYENLCDSSGCCGSDTDCTSGYWCADNSKRCVKCPTSKSSAYFNGYCASGNCVGQDADCCNTDSDCATANSLSGVTHYCEATTHKCTPCSRSLDYYCPSPVCYVAGPASGDPDCCESTPDCVDGSICTDDRCIPKAIGAFCKSSEDCGSGDFSCINNRCVLNSFVTAIPSNIELKVGQVRTVSVVAIDPQLKNDQYAISVSGTGSMFAVFTENKNPEFSLEPNGIQKLTLQVYGGRKTDSSTVKLMAVSTTNPQISYEKVLSLKIESAESDFVGKASGLTLVGAFLTLLLGGLIIWKVPF
ncbi:MAG TPA: hypothetical protein ENN60_03195 [archaeon]|nr:hypothetical protein [archaeon]